MVVLSAGCWESSSHGREGAVFKVLVLQHPLMVPLGGRKDACAWLGAHG